MKLIRPLLLTLSLFSCILAGAQQKFTINGYVRDSVNGEAMIGASVFVQELNSGISTNEYGFYSITIPAADYVLKFSYVGYSVISKAVVLDKNIRLDVELRQDAKQLQEVEVSDEKDRPTAQNQKMSVSKLDISTIKRIPAFLGEVDVIRSLLLLPGVSTVGEGASGFNVRGGSVGQNLIYLDEAPVYNSSHLLGFFSVFNPDAVKDVTLFKGAVPASVWGRELASVLDVRMKDGNSKKMQVTGGIGTIFSRVAVEGPLIKDKASFIIALRRSYIDIFGASICERIKEWRCSQFLRPHPEDKLQCKSEEQIVSLRLFWSRQFPVQ